MSPIIIFLAFAALAFAYVANVAGFRDMIDYHLVRTFVPPTDLLSILTTKDMSSIELLSGATLITSMMSLEPIS